MAEVSENVLTQLRLPKTIIHIGGNVTDVETVLTQYQFFRPQTRRSRRGI